jgi:hypothetical protein
VEGGVPPPAVRPICTCFARSAMASLQTASSTMCEGRERDASSQTDAIQKSGTGNTDRGTGGKVMCCRNKHGKELLYTAQSLM